MKHDALKLLLLYPATCPVSAFYQGLETDDPVFIEAVRTVLGDDAEYPDFSHKKIGAIIKLALNSIESNASGTPYWQQTSNWIAEMRSSL